MVPKDNNPLNNITYYLHAYEWVNEKGKVFHIIESQLIHVENHYLATNNINFWHSWELWMGANLLGEHMKTNKELFTWFQSIFETNYKG